MAFHGCYSLYTEHGQIIAGIDVPVDSEAGVATELAHIYLRHCRSQQDFRVTVHQQHDHP